MRRFGTMRGRGLLYIEGRSTVKLAEGYGTALYVMEE